MNIWFKLNILNNAFPIKNLMISFSLFKLLVSYFKFQKASLFPHPIKRKTSQKLVVLMSSVHVALTDNRGTWGLSLELQSSSVEHYYLLLWLQLKPCPFGIEFCSILWLWVYIAQRLFSNRSRMGWKDILWSVTVLPEINMQSVCFK